MFLEYTSKRRGDLKSFKYLQISKSSFFNQLVQLQSKSCQIVLQRHVIVWSYHKKCRLKCAFKGDPARLNSNFTAEVKRLLSETCRSARTGLPKLFNRRRGMPATNTFYICDKKTFSFKLFLFRPASSATSIA